MLVHGHVVVQPLTMKILPDSHFFKYNTTGKAQACHSSSTSDSGRSDSSEYSKGKAQACNASSSSNCRWDPLGVDHVVKARFSVML